MSVNGSYFVTIFKFKFPLLQTLLQRQFHSDQGLLNIPELFTKKLDSRISATRNFKVGYRLALDFTRI